MENQVLLISINGLNVFSGNTNLLVPHAKDFSKFSNHIIIFICQDFMNLQLSHGITLE